ncbi:hypothetical protein V7157_27940 [Neobacillus drentensis]|uniref:hypothetical protein n=1 Tax=Neobacillus drentensis TaxID=220684 RepID=UPI00300216CF
MFPIPPIEEQVRIAKFLDNKCSKIDETIEKEKEIIEKLNAYKQSVITEVMARGLCPDSPKKDSNVRWIGEIPDKWSVMKLGVVADVQTGPFGSQLHQEDYVEVGTPIITVEHFGDDNTILHKNLPYVSDEDVKRLEKYRLILGDLVFSRVGSVDKNVIDVFDRRA